MEMLKLKEEKKRGEGLRIWVDGCFDLFHSGHTNFLRKVKEKFGHGCYLIVGVHSDSSILENKGPTVLKNEERYQLVKSCKFVDEVVENAPYKTKVIMLNKYSINFCVHGSDTVNTRDGVSCYEEVIKAGLYKTVTRTKGISTTNLINRILSTVDKNMRVKQRKNSKLSIPSSVLLRDYSIGNRNPKKNECVVYVDGNFDLFNLGHVELFRKIKKSFKNAYLLIGIYSNETVKSCKGKYPIMNMEERILSVLSCRHVNNIVIAAPYVVDQEMIETYEIDYVVVGSNSSHQDLKGKYNFPFKNDMLKIIESPIKTNHRSIVKRIIENKQNYVKRNKAKKTDEELFQEIVMLKEC